MSYMRKSRYMNPRIDWLNGQIDRMQAGRGMAAIDLAIGDAPGETIALLQMAAQLNSLRPGALEPAPGFLAGLRERVLSACDEPGGRRGSGSFRS